MKKTLTISLLLLSLIVYPVYSQDDDTVTIDEQETGEEVEYDAEEIAELLQAYSKYGDSIEATMNYKYGEVILDGGIATMHVPEGYKFLEKEQAMYVLSELWENPEDPSCLGLLIKEEENPVEVTYAVEVSYEEEGYIDDDDAEDLDYDDLLEEMQNDAIVGNEQRSQLGYQTIELVGWAAPPFYDSEHHKLQWAKELKFEGEDLNTLNYNIRVLGRKGFINLNVIGDMDALEDVQDNLDPILVSTTFNAGYQYSDFNPDIDTVAAYGIGGLIAGKVLAKAGFFAVLLKFWKFIAIGAVALFAGLKKRIFGGGSN